jgi:hypothetical protein
LLSHSQLDSNQNYSCKHQVSLLATIVLSGRICLVEPDKNITKPLDMSTVERRSFIATVATIPLGAVVPTVDGVENLPQLEESDPVARALEYVLPTSNKAQPCSNCQLFQGGENPGWGTCGIFPNKCVNATGWCKSWIRKVV